MNKKIISFILALLMPLSLLTIPVKAAGRERRTAIRQVVVEQLGDYADSVNQKNADDEAFTDFFGHGFFGFGKKIVLTDESPMTAVLFNSCFMREVLEEIISEAIIAMQDVEADCLYTQGPIGWHSYYYNYSGSGYAGESPDSMKYVRLLASSMNSYGKDHYRGPKNENDKVLELIAGEIQMELVVKRKKVDGHSAVYEAELTLTDCFDFKGDYDELADKGYDTSTDDRLNNLGKLLTLVGIREFEWSLKKTLQFEVPMNCSHATENYRWSFHGTDQTLKVHAADGFSENAVELLSHTITYQQPDGNVAVSVRKYYELEHTAALKHDRPWVMELDYKPLLNLQLGPADTSSTSYPVFNLSQSYIGFSLVDFQDPRTALDKIYAVGVDFADRFDCNRNKTYTYQLENKVYDDGSNMIYVTVYDCASGELVFGPEPVDECKTKLNTDKEYTNMDGASDLLVGKDIYINYIGTKDTTLYLPELVFDLRIWENGKDSSSDTMVTKEHLPTCTEQGGVVHTCTDCGYSYTTDTVPATGHSYGKYAFDNNATCTADGTRTRKCTVCGVKDTVTAPDTAKGHDYKSKVTPPTYTEQGYTTYTCTVCGDSYKDDYVGVKQHNYTAVVTAPTCTEQGYTTYTCTECGDSYVDDYTEIVDHTPVIDPAVKPTCSEKGKTEGSHCGVCGLVLKKQALISTNNSHSMEETVVTMPTYDAPGQAAYICKDCGKTEYMEIPPLTKPVLVNPFTDVQETDWFYEPVLWAVENKVTGGKTETTFAPNEGCTRAQVVTFLWAANGKPAPVSMENPFADIADSDWYYNAVLWAVEQGITGGISATEFGPNQTCTRAQIATFLWAAKGKMPVNGTSEFTDVADSEWYAAPIIWAKENDITGGIGDGKFGPNDTCTRAQVVTFLKKVYG